ncbi:MAG: histidine phosphatase family protein, partial [Dehalococcoidia bacterium]|nr:histidine phosphatase family protein [Dehalococcoidia bacterium]
DERNRQTVLVSHEIVVKLIVAHVLGAPYSVYRRFEVANASLSEVRITDGRMKLITLNDTAHLGD